jgi:hypothetical protein
VVGLVGFGLRLSAICDCAVVGEPGVLSTNVGESAGSDGLSGFVVACQGDSGMILGRHMGSCVEPIVVNLLPFVGIGAGGVGHRLSPICVCTGELQLLESSLWVCPWVRLALGHWSHDGWRWG